MEDKEKYNDFYYYVNKFSKKLKNLKEVIRTIGAQNKDFRFPDEESFLLEILRTLSNRLASESSWLSAVISQPNTYLQILAYNYLKKKDKLNEAKKLVEKILTLVLELDTTTLELKPQKNKLIEFYNKVVDRAFELNEEYITFAEMILDEIKNDKSKKEKDVYIG
jgi:hypothetical protein